MPSQLSHIECSVCQKLNTGFSGLKYSWEGFFQGLQGRISFLTYLSYWQNSIPSFNRTEVPFLCHLRAALCFQKLPTFPGSWSFSPSSELQQGFSPSHTLNLSCLFCDIPGPTLLPSSPTCKGLYDYFGRTWIIHNILCVVVSVTLIPCVRSHFCYVY